MVAEALVVVCESVADFVAREGGSIVGDGEPLMLGIREPHVLREVR